MSGFLYSMRIHGINNIINFQRRPTKDEEPDLKETINKAYDVIGAKERVVITHGSCFPAIGRDTHIGSPFGKAAKEYIKFLSLYGFNGNQLGPCGELQKWSNSPYNSSAFAKNKLFIDLEQLTEAKYGKILSEKTYNDVTSIPENTDKNYTMVDFVEADLTYNKALKESFNNFKVKVSKGQPAALALNQEFDKFLEKHDERLTDEGIFRALAYKYGTDDYMYWDKKEDRELITNVKNGDLDAIDYYNDLVEQNKNSIEQYKFEQFIATKQIKENKEWRDEIDFKYINDLLVGCSKMDAWRYEDAFLDDWEMGARENSTTSQRWHIPIIDPKKIMTGDELSTGGKFLKEKIDFALEFCENIRVDHVMGLIEPYIMAKHADDKDFKTDPPSIKNKNMEMYISELKNPENPNEEYDFYWDYPKLIERIVLPAFKEHGIEKDLPVWEDICSWPDRFKKVYGELQLPKITNVDWERAEDAVRNMPNNWFILGSHDNIPVMNYLKREGDMRDGSKGEYTREQDTWNPEYLAGYLNMDDSRENIQEIRKELQELYKSNDREYVFAKFAELMTTPKFQISFDDLLGIVEEGIVYNIPGSTRDDNWKERISPDFIDKYYENLSSENPTALNIPELLKQALQAKVDMEVRAHNYDENFKKEIYEKCQPLLDKLEHYSEILKEPE